MIKYFYWPLAFVVSLVAAKLVLEGTKRYEPRNHDAILKGLELGRLYWITATITLLLVMADGVASLVRSEAIQYDAEVGSLIVSWMFAQGWPMYHGAESAERYALLYGPGMYLPIAWVFQMGGEMLAGRMVGMVGAVVGMVATFALVRRDSRKWFFLMWMLLGFMLMLRPTFTARMDSWLYAFAALAALAASRGNLVAIGILAGIAATVKVTAVLYFAPLAVWAFLIKRPTKTEIATGMAAAVVVALAPFALPGIGLVDYLEWIKAAGKHGIDMTLLGSNVGVLLLILFPALWSCYLAQGWSGESRTAFLGLMVTVAVGTLIAITAGKVGSGYYHLVPIVPAVLLTMRQAPSWKLGATLQFASILNLVFILLGFLFVSYNLVAGGSTGSKKVTPEALAEIDTAIARVGDARLLSIGTGKLENRSTNALPYLVRKGGSYLLSDVAMWDMEQSGLAIPAETIERIRRCVVPYWLIPAGDTPFHTENLYAPSRLMLEPVREAFMGRYQKIEGGKTFDLWACTGRQ